MPEVARPEDPDRRLLSLDVFRGITVAAMVLVNNPGTWRAVYGPLRHADWHGWTPTDLIFPFFLFIVGVAIPFGLGRRLDADHGRGQIVLKVLRRAVVIFLLGLVLHAISSMDLATIRIPGVLQRIAVCYLVASLVFLALGRGAQLWIATVALLAYWAALTLIPVPGFGAGDLGKEGNLAAWIDRTVLGAHIWRVGRVYDPEGILSTIPAIATTLLGVLTGQWLRGARVSAAIARRLLFSGVAGVVIGLAWGRWFPINKSLWTSSYAVFTAGAALLALAACYWLIEIKRSRWWTGPFRLLGVNALAVFFLSTLLAILLARISMLSAGGRAHSLQAIVFDALFAPWTSPAAASLAWAAANIVLWLAILWPFSRRGLRLTV
jgi:predicted acyltransferase